MNLDYSTESVPDEARRSLTGLSLVLAGVPLCAAGLYAGAALAQSLTFAESIKAAIIAGLIVTLHAGTLGAIGARTGLSTALLLRECFGKLGAALVTITLSLCLVGWFAVQTGFFGQAIQSIFPEGGLLVTPAIASCWGGMLMLTTAYVGYRGLSALSIVAVPLITLLSVWGFLSATRSMDLFSVVPANAGTMGASITMLVGAFAVGATVNSDITRFARSSKHAWIASISGFFIANIFILICGAGTAMATGSGDLIAAMTALGMGTPALIVLVLGQWTTNDNNIYLASLSAAGGIPRVNKSSFVLVFGATAILLAASGVADSFIPFLIWLGVLIPPIGGVLIAHFYLCEREAINSQNGQTFSFLATLAWASGCLAGSLLEFGIPALNSIFASLLVYTAIYSFIKRRSETLSTTNT